MNNYNW